MRRVKQPFRGVQNPDLGAAPVASARDWGFASIKVEPLVPVH
jgi:hypothetical protein